MRKRPTTPCKYEGCDGWAWAQGYCDPHYQKLKRLGIIQKQRVFGDDVERFHTKYEVNPFSGCWEWTAGIHPSGYGSFHVTRGGKQWYTRPHRFAYEKLVGEIPHGKLVLHSCDNRRCVNPGHLFLGDHRANMVDCMTKGRSSLQKGTTRPKITWAMATNIRVMYARSQHSLLDIARIYGAGLTTIHGIARGHSHLKNRDHIIKAAGE